MKRPSGTTDRRPSLNRERVISGAVALADEIGVDALTIRKLATALNVKPMSIYHYVPNKDAIIDGMVDSVFCEIEKPAKNGEWKIEIRRRCHSARAALVRHPWAAALMDSRRSPGTTTLEHHDAVLACLRDGGLSVEMTAHAYALIDAFVYGFALQETSLPATKGDDIAELAETIMTGPSTEQYPYLAELTQEHILKPGYDFALEFDFGLDLILDGLDRASAASADKSTTESV